MLTDGVHFVQSLQGGYYQKKTIISCIFSWGTVLKCHRIKVCVRNDIWNCQAYEVFNVPHFVYNNKSLHNKYRPGHNMSITKFIKKVDCNLQKLIGSTNVNVLGGIWTIRLLPTWPWEILTRTRRISCITSWRRQDHTWTGIPWGSRGRVRSLL